MTKDMKKSEFQLIDFIKKDITYGAEVIKGIGDDCAAIKANGNILVSTDALVDNVHFISSRTAAEDLAFKTYAQNASDITAMGGIAKYFFLNLSIPRGFADDFISSFISHLKQILKTHQIQLLGGNISHSQNDFSINCTILGDQAGNVIFRNGATAGDHIYLLKKIGDAAAGANIFVHHTLSEIKENALWHKLYLSHFHPHIFQNEIIFIKNSITAMTDISDGLLQDLSHICSESDTTAQINYDKIPIADNVIEYSKNNKQLQDFVLNGGEEFCPIFSANPNAVEKLRVKYEQKFNSKIYDIGAMHKKSKSEKLITVFNEEKPLSVEITGYDHLA